MPSSKKSKALRSMKAATWISSPRSARKPRKPRLTPFGSPTSQERSGTALNAVEDIATDIATDSRLGTLVELYGPEAVRDALRSRLRSGAQGEAIGHGAVQLVSFKVVPVPKQGTIIVLLGRSDTLLLFAVYESNFLPGSMAKMRFVEPREVPEYLADLGVDVFFARQIAYELGVLYKDMP